MGLAKNNFSQIISNVITDPDEANYSYSPILLPLSAWTNNQAAKTKQICSVLFLNYFGPNLENPRGFLGCNTNMVRGIQ